MSIRLRLTLWYTALLALVLTIFSVLLYTVVSVGLRNDVDTELNTRGDQVEALVQEAVRRDPVLFARTRTIRIPLPLDVFSSPDVVVQIVRASDGEVLQASDNLGNQTLPHSDAMLTSARNGQSAYSTFTTDTHVRFRILTAPILLNEKPIAIVQVGSALQGIERTLNVLALVLTVGALSAVALAAAIGSVLASSALKPIDDITRAARAIARTKDLEQRVRETHNADEVDRLAITFNEMLQRLENLFRTQQRFLADVSHELRTPLTIIRGNLSLLRKTSTPADREVICTMDDEAERMARLVSDLLLLAQSDAGAAALKREPVELDTLLLDVYRQARIIAAARDGQLKITLGAEDQAMVEGDSDRLKQLLLNLIENAIKYTPSGEVKLSLEKKDGQVGLSVSDTGLGIPAADVPHIFERFYRADKARARAPATGSGGGTGLGLSIADWIAKAHGGYIAVQSAVGKGSTFTVWLPEKK